MASSSRKLLTYSSNETLYELCYPYCDLSNDLGYCRSPCVDFCFAFCPFDLTPPPSSDNNHPSKMLVAILTVLAAAFVLVTCYALYSKVYLDPLRRTRTRLQEEGNERRAEFLDEDHGPVVDHPIWYINTIGLQPSVISSITIFEYKKGVGLAEGTDCAVCLNEFEDSETLRLLPKCSHAFHIPCIDTWLRSHTNCPLCRAPIVASTARLGSVEGGDASVGGREGTRIDVQENGGGLDGETGSANGEFVRDGTEEFVRGQEKIQSLRRSVSMDSISALKIAMAMENAQHQMESREDDSGSQSGRAGGNHRLVQFMASSSPSSDSGGRSSEAGSSSASVIRSFSCSGELFSARYNSRTISLCDAPPRKIAGSST